MYFITKRYFENTRREGTYHIYVCVIADGSVVKAVLVRSMPEDTTEKLYKAAFDLKYEPAMKDGQPVEAWDLWIGGAWGPIVIRN